MQGESSSSSSRTRIFYSSNRANANNTELVRPSAVPAIDVAQSSSTISSHNLILEPMSPDMSWLNCPRVSPETFDLGFDLNRNDSDDNTFRRAVESRREAEAAQQHVDSGCSTSGSLNMGLPSDTLQNHGQSGQGTPMVGFAMLGTERPESYWRNVRPRTAESRASFSERVSLFGTSVMNSLPIPPETWQADADQRFAAVSDEVEDVEEDVDEGNDLLEEMWLDIDDMSYEDLVDLQDQIGFVSTGLGEEAISMRMRRYRYAFSLGLACPEDEKICCICLDEFAIGDELGKLDCGHDFHSSCIAPWLMQKNLCPICKKTALA
ncbi:hypothetical protein RJ640_030465 [Escallonia rubra]|uniref:RING-type E3 ubiquitin transferase n=1 Tax=Escallonia rubra TaxID=112253 RepID=A0AA88QC51_9ASTE|nr:hypothetical protein RJ640_030465 [Escallonia rubra]